VKKSELSKPFAFLLPAFFVLLKKVSFTAATKNAARVKMLIGKTILTYLTQIMLFYWLSKYE
jgi:ethanolamine transporter EutH